MATDPLLERLAAQAWPKPLGDHPVPAPGQLWRAAWDGVVALVVVLAAPAGRTVRVATASPESTGDETAVEVETTNSMRLVVWSSVSSEIMMCTLDHRIGDLTEASLQSLRQLMGASRAWGPIVSVLDDRAILRAELRDELDVMHDAEWLDARSPGAADIASLAAERGLKASDLARALSISAGSARRLRQGQRGLAPGEAELLIPLLGEVPSSAVTFDPGLVEKLDLPRFRPAIDDRATRQFAGDETAARREFATAVLSMAARQREPGERNWEALIDEVLRAD